MDLTGLGTVLGGIGSLAGGASGLFGQGSSGGFKGRDFKQQMKLRLKYARQYGEQYGFHPLAALGVQPTSMPAQRAFGSGKTGRALANMGQGMGNIMKGLDTNAQRLNNEKTQAEIDYINARRKSIEQSAGQPDQLKVDNLGNIQGQVPDTNYQTPVKSTTASPGIQPGFEPFFRHVGQPDGGYKIYPTQSMQEVTSEGVHALEYGGQLALNYAKGLVSNWKGDGPRRYRNTLRSIKKYLDRAVGQGLEMRYNVYRRAWYIHPDEGRLFEGFKFKNYGRGWEHGIPNYRLKQSHRDSRTEKLMDWRKQKRR